MKKHTQFYIEQLNKEAAGDNLALTQGLPLGMAFGGGVGLTRGLMEDPGYDQETGARKSKIKQVILQTILGSAAGGIAGYAGTDIAQQLKA